MLNYKDEILYVILEWKNVYAFSQILYNSCWKIVDQVLLQGKGLVFQCETSQVSPWCVMCTMEKQKYCKDRIPKIMVIETYNNDIHSVLNTFLCQKAMFCQ